MLLQVTLVVLLVVHDQATQDNKEDKEFLPLGAAIKKVISNKQVWLAGFYGFALFSIVNVVATLWGIPFVVHQYQPLSLHTAGTLMSMVFIGIAIGGPFLAWLSQRWQNRQTVMSLCALLTTLIFATILYVPRLPLWSLYILLLSVGFFSSSYIQVFAVVKDAVPMKVRATALSATNMILMSSAPLLQPLVGKFLALKFTFPQALSVIQVILMLAVFISFSMDKKAVSEDSDLTG